MSRIQFSSPEASRRIAKVREKSTGAEVALRCEVYRRGLRYPTNGTAITWGRPDTNPNHADVRDDRRCTNEIALHTENVSMTKPSTDQAQASPTKQFFVSMLTRDISLADAILDLLDNCLDGALRLADGKDVDYAKHFVKIELTDDHFSIADNCGGIPRDVAKNYAF